MRSKLLMSATAMLCAFGGAGAPSATAAGVHTGVKVAVVALPRDLATLDRDIQAQAHRAHASAAAVQLARRASTLLYGDYVRVAKLQGEPVSRKSDFAQGFVGTNAQAVRLDTVIPNLLAHRCASWPTASGACATATISAASFAATSTGRSTRREPSRAFERCRCPAA